MTQVEADRINVSRARGGAEPVTPNGIPSEFEQYDYEQQRRDNPERFASATASTPTGATLDHEKVIEQLRRENELLKSQAEVLTAASKRPLASANAAVTFDQAYARLGQWAGINKLTRTEQATYMQVDPSVTDERLKYIFGPTISTQEQADIQRANPQAYAAMREFAKLRRVYATR